VLYFSTNTALYRSNGTAAGTTVVKSFFASPMQLTNVNGTIFFTVAGGSKGFQLWRSNGTAAGTILLREYGPGAPGSLTNLNGSLYFAANDGTRGTELWRSNGTVAGTTLVKDIFPGSSTDPDAPGVNSSNPSGITAFNGRIYFSANNGVNGAELWRSDGTSAGTVLVKDLLPESTEGFAFGSNPNRFRVVNNSLYFVASNLPQGVDRVFRTDGTAQGTIDVGGSGPGGFGRSSSITAFENVNGNLYYATFAQENFLGFYTELWRITDGVNTFIRKYPQGVTGESAGIEILRT
jgi:ELWxxDGT repeat protein